MHGGPGRFQDVPGCLEYPIRDNDLATHLVSSRSGRFRGIPIGRGYGWGYGSTNTPVLTTLQIKSAKPAERAFKLADAGGLFLLVQPNGAKLWRLWNDWASAATRSIADVAGLAVRAVLHCCPGSADLARRLTTHSGRSVNIDSGQSRFKRLASSCH